MIKRVNSINTTSSGQENPYKRKRSGVPFLTKNKKQVYIENSNIRIPAAAPATKTATHANRYIDSANTVEPPNIATNGSPNADLTTNASPDTNLATTKNASVARIGTSSAVSTENQATQRRKTHRGPNKCANLQGSAKTKKASFRR